MIKFNSKSKDKQYVSITGYSIPTDELLKQLIAVYPIIKKGFYKADDEEILLTVDNDIHYGFCLKDLRKTVQSISPGCVITHFCVDLSLPAQRFM